MRRGLHPRYTVRVMCDVQGRVLIGRKSLQSSCDWLE